MDAKKVKVKGSELGYSLQTIERILENKMPLQSKALISYPSIAQRTPEGSTEQSLLTGVEKNVSKMLTELLKPEANQQQLNPYFPQKPKQKKKRSLRL